jgi:hypothetical protein
MVNPNRRSPDKYAPGNFSRVSEQSRDWGIASLGLSSGESIFGTDGIFPLALHFVRAFYHGVH